MCLKNLFGGDVNCSWLLFILCILLLIDNNDCGCGYDGGCGCRG